MFEAKCILKPFFCHKHWGLESSLITNLQLAYTKKYELRASMGSLANWQDKMNWWLEKCEWSSNQGCNEAMCDWWLRKECVVLRCGQEILKIEIIDGVGLEGNGMSCNGLMEWKSIPKHKKTPWQWLTPSPCSTWQLVLWAMTLACLSVSLSPESCTLSWLNLALSKFDSEKCEWLQCNWRKESIYIQSWHFVYFL